MSRRAKASASAVASLAALSILAVGAGPALAATSGDRDRSFGEKGVVRTDVGGVDEVSDVAVQTDGKIVVVGSSDGNVAVARYTRHGVLDTTFSRDGKVVTDLGGAEDSGAAVALDASGRVVVAAGADLAPTTGQDSRSGVVAVLRYTTTGALDTTFGGGDGKWVDTSAGYVRDVLVQPNQKIVTVGLNLLRFEPSGVPDPKFASPDVSSDGQGYRYVVRQDNGGYVIGSRSDAASAEIQRYTPDGVEDRTFQRNAGGAVGAQAVGLHALGDKTLMVSEGVYDSAPQWVDDYSGHAQITLEKFLANGRHDSSFGRRGVRIVDLRRWPGAAADTDPTASALAPDGRIVVVSPTYVARFRPGGKLDKTFSGDGIAVLGTQSVAAVQRDGRIVLAGDKDGDFVVQRLLG